MSKIIHTDQNLKQELEDRVHADCAKSLADFYERLQKSIVEIYPGKVKTADVLFMMSCFLNSIRFFAKDIFFQLPNFFNEVPIPMEGYERMLLESLSEDFQEVRSHYEKKEKREDLIELVTH